MSQFHIASEQDILLGKVTDAYFVRTQEILDKTDISKHVVMELRASSLPFGWEWAVFAGLEELVYFFERLQHPIDLFCLDEGTLFRPNDPVAYVIGDYKDICIYETTILGFLCQASGIATRAARCVLAAQGRPVLSFGARRMHPTITPLIDRNAYIGGCTGVSTIVTAEKLGKNAAGTMPHALILLVGDTLEAAKLFDEIVNDKIPRIALIDTFSDEKLEAIRVAEAMGDKLYGIRVDTPSSRRGDFLSILEEIRWELDIRGYKSTRIVVSGGMDEYSILEYNPVCYGYGVGTSISNAPVVDYSLDIVEIANQPIAKRGKMSGRKRLLIQGNRLDERQIVFWTPDDPLQKHDALTRKIKQGQNVMMTPSADKIRNHVINQLSYVDL